MLVSSWISYTLAVALLLREKITFFLNPINVLKNVTISVKGLGGESHIDCFCLEAYM